ncbi:MAG: universal stress protein [Deltaproteobacteria bacterium]|nr:universal stress protein [Deltaproteobacteria bacterium]
MPTIRRILVPTDFSRCSEAAMDYALDLAQKLGAQVQLLHVWEVPVGIGVEAIHVVSLPEGGRASLAEFVRGEAEKELGRLMTSLKERGFTVQAKLTTGEPGRQIVDAAKEADLVVMGTHGRGAVAHFLLGSVTERVIRKSTTPVLTIRVPEAEAS